MDKPNIEGHWLDRSTGELTRKQKTLLLDQTEIPYDRTNPPPRPFRFTPKQATILKSRAVTLSQIANHVPKTFTLTYPVQLDKSAQEVKSDWNIFRTQCKRDFGLLSHIWCLELTRKGQYHFHVLADLPHIDYKGRKHRFTPFDKFNQTWTTIAGFSSRIGVQSLEAVKDFDEAAGYMGKVSSYLSKKERYKEEGIGTRLWGTSNDLVKGDRITVKDRHNFEYIVKKSKYLRKSPYCITGQIKISDGLPVFDEYVY